MFLNTSDFIGFYKISGNSHTSAELLNYINDLEPTILRKLLGVELYDLFIADLDANNQPQSQRFIDIFNPFSYDYNSTIIESKGIKEMLKGFIYYEYVRDSDYFNVISGNVKNSFGNSEKARGVEYGLNERYNKALLTFCNIQEFINQNDSVYPEFNGQMLEVKHWL